MTKSKMKTALSLRSTSELYEHDSKEQYNGNPQPETLSANPCR